MRATKPRHSHNRMPGRHREHFHQGVDGHGVVGLPPDGTRAACRTCGREQRRYLYGQRRLEGLRQCGAPIRECRRSRKFPSPRITEWGIWTAESPSSWPWEGRSCVVVPYGARVLGPPDNPPVVRADQDCPGWP